MSGEKDITAELLKVFGCCRIAIGLVKIPDGIAQSATEILVQIFVIACSAVHYFDFILLSTPILFFRL